MKLTWKSRIVAVTDGFVVLDKPAGTTVRVITHFDGVLSIQYLLSGTIKCFFSTANYLLSSTTGNIGESCATRAFAIYLDLIALITGRDRADSDNSDASSMSDIMG